MPKSIPETVDTDHPDRNRNVDYAAPPGFTGRRPVSRRLRGAPARVTRDWLPPAPAITEEEAKPIASFMLAIVAPIALGSLLQVLRLDFLLLVLAVFYAVCVLLFLGRTAWRRFGRTGSPRVAVPTPEAVGRYRGERLRSRGLAGRVDAATLKPTRAA